MCINPRLHPSGLTTPCRQCWQCNENRINDWVGRCIAEKETSLATSFVTLTYGGGDTAQSRFLRKSDLTAAFKALRNDGHLIRYFAVGEYGTAKGRAHWHVILFWQSKMPHVEFGKNVHVGWWPHGHTFWADADHKGIRYVMKYINKKENDEDQLKAMAMSRKPMLGSRFFNELADRYIAQGLAPQKPYYKFRDVLDKHGKPIEFYMPPLVRERFCLAYIQKWTAKYPGRHWPNSEMLDGLADKLAQYVPPMRYETRRMRDAPWMAPPDGARELFDEKLNAFYCIVEGQRLFWTFDERGQRTWARKIVTETEAERRQAAFAARKEFGPSSGLSRTVGR